MSPDLRQAFLKAVLDNPDDDAPRLIFADALDEYGESEYGEFIRVQVSLAALSALPLVVPAGTTELVADGLGGWLHAGDVPRAAALRRREGGLLDTNFGLWTDGLPESFVTRQCPHCVDATPDWETNAIECRQCDGTGLIPNQDNVEFRRGFVAAVTCTAVDWQQHGDRISAPNPLPAPREFVTSWQPVEEVTLTTWPTLNYQPDPPGQLAGFVVYLNGRPERFRLGDGPGEVPRPEIIARNDCGMVEILMKRVWPRVAFTLPPPEPVHHGLIVTLPDDVGSPESLARSLTAMERAGRDAAMAEEMRIINAMGVPVDWPVASPPPRPRQGRRRR